MTKFWERYSDLCAQKGYYISSLPQKIGISNGAYIKWRDNDAIPRGKNLQALADFLEVSISYLLGEDEEEAETPDERPANEDIIRMQEYCEILSRTKSGISRLAFLVDEAKRMTEEVAEYERKIAEIDALDESRKTENA